MKAAIIALLILIAGSLGYLVHDRIEEKSGIAKEHRAQESAREAVREAIEHPEIAREAKVREAVNNQEILAGMTEREVERVWGLAEREQTSLGEDRHEQGIYAIRYYSKGRVFFDRHGLVKEVSPY